MQELKKKGLKVTVPRMIILELLQNAGIDHHYSAEAIYEELREKNHDIGLATVYRVLAQFEQAGILSKHYFESGLAVYELNNGDNHDHIVCIKCSKIREFIDSDLEKKQASIAEGLGYQLEEHSTILYGVCKDCQ